MFSPPHSTKPRLHLETTRRSSFGSTPPSAPTLFRPLHFPWLTRVLDVDECANAKVCGNLDKCTNYIGGFNCSCFDGRILLGDQCVWLNNKTIVMDTTADVGAGDIISRFALASMSPSPHSFCLGLFPSVAPLLPSFSRSASCPTTCTAPRVGSSTNVPLRKW